MASPTPASPPQKTATRSVLSFLLASPLVLALLIRLPLALIQRTPFQPDETYQSLEPAHRIVFGYGHLTWEWQPNEAVDRVWWGWMAEGRLRGSGWVGVWVVVYSAVKAMGIESWALTVAPQVVMALIASVCDWSTYKLAGRLFGTSVAPTALLLSVTSLFHAHALTRPFTNSVETSLTILALSWWPFPSGFALTRLGWSERSTTRVALVIAAITFTLRPTNMVLWIFLGAQLVYSRWSSGRRKEARQVVFDAVWIGILVLLPSTLLDTLLFPPPPGSTLPFTFPLLPFLTYNVLLPTSLFYGSNPWHYYLFQAVPILLLPSLPLALPAIVAAARGKLGPDASVLAGLVGWSTAVYSIIGHKEWRFLHPLVPVAHVLTARWIAGRGKKMWSVGPPITVWKDNGGQRVKVRTIFGLPPKSWTIPLMIVPIGPIVYLSLFHERAQHAVIDYIRQAGPEVTSVGVLMPCHSTPWQSHLHRQDIDEASWFLTCDPPKGLPSPSSLPHTTPESHFFSSPSRYLRLNFPSTHSPSPKSFAALQRMVPSLRAWPSHFVFFGALLYEPGVQDLLVEKGYAEVAWDDGRKWGLGWGGWNGWDWAQDDERRRGGVQVWKWQGDKE